MDRARLLAAHLPLGSRHAGGAFAPLRSLRLLGALLLLGSLLVGVSGATEPSLLVGVLGAVLCAWSVVSHSTVILSTAAAYGPAVAARDHHRALARRAVPRQRDPDAAGHTRSRAPSGLLPAV